MGDVIKKDSAYAASRVIKKTNNKIINVFGLINLIK